MKKNKRFKSDFLRFKYINKFIKGKEILDLGSKEGYLHELLIKANLGKKIYSCDLRDSDFNLDLNKEWEFKKKFDTIIAGEIIEHLENPVEFIKKCSNHLRKKGRLILTTPNALGLQYLRNPSWCVEEGHNFAFTLPMLEKLFNKNGFNIIYKGKINAFWINNPLQIIPLLIPRIKTDLIVVGEKK